MKVYIDKNENLKIKKNVKLKRFYVFIAFSILRRNMEISFAYVSFASRTLFNGVIMFGFLSDMLFRVSAFPANNAFRAEIIPIIPIRVARL